MSTKITNPFALSKRVDLNEPFYDEAKQAAEETRAEERNDLKSIISRLFATNCIYEVEHDQEKIAAIKAAKEAIQ